MFSIYIDAFPICFDNISINYIYSQMPCHNLETAKIINAFFANLLTFYIWISVFSSYFDHVCE